MKICKQCHRTLEDDQFRSIKPRGAGLRKTTTGTRAVCRYCENMNVKAHQLNVALDRGEPINESKLAQVKAYYTMLADAGYQPIHSAAARLMGVSAAAQSNCTSDRGTDDLYKHIAAVRDRTYSSFDAADAAHRRLEPALRAAGLYELAANLIDEWFEDGEED